MKIIESIEKLNSEEISYLKRGINILDIGCGLGTNYWYNLHKILKFKKIIGIDKYSQEELKIINELPNSSINSHDTYLKEMRRLNHYILNEQNILNEQEFTETFIFKKIEVEKYSTTKSDCNKFELIIISQLLHLLKTKNEARELVKKIQSNLNSNGYLYIFVASEYYKIENEYPSGFEEKRVKISFTENELKELIFPMQYCHSNLYSEFKNNFRDILCRK